VLWGVGVDWVALFELDDPVADALDDDAEADVL
jgi:hypothetical protein